MRERYINAKGLEQNILKRHIYIFGLQNEVNLPERQVRNRFIFALGT